MRMPRRWSGAVLALAMSSMASACADDVPATTIDFGDGTTTGGPPTTTFTGADDTAGSSTGSDPDATTIGETEDATGGTVLPGRSASQLVAAGDRSTSRSYQLVFAVGQPSQLRSTHESASYVLRGGLVGANGSPP